jgi:hypothetical protein
MSDNTIYVSVNMEHDLMMSGDETYAALTDLETTWLYDLFESTEPVEIGGLVVSPENAARVLHRYVAAWEQAWIETAERMGHHPIASEDPMEIEEWVRRNQPEDTDTDNPWGESWVQHAWQQVWDECPVVHLTPEMVYW